MNQIMEYNQSLKTEVDNLTKLLLQSNEVINSLHAHREARIKTSSQNRQTEEYDNYGKIYVTENKQKAEHQKGIQKYTKVSIY